MHSATAATTAPRPRSPPRYLAQPFGRARQLFLVEDPDLLPASLKEYQRVFVDDCLCS